MANDLVVTLGARLDQFASDMNQAGDIADSAVSKIEQSFGNLNPGINLGALATFSTAAVAGFGALLTALQKVNAEMADLAKNAEYAGVSVARFQELQFAASQGGVGADQAATDLRNVAKLLADAKENENSLTKLLDTNNIKYVDRNDDVISLNKLLTIAGDLINKFGSMPEKVEAAKMLGLSEAWVSALHDGGKAFNDLAAGAEAAGAVIDGATIAKAAAFDEAWKKSTALLGLQFKAVSGDIAGWLDDLIDKANEFFAALTAARGGAPDAGQQKFNAYADAIAVAEKEARGLAQDVEQLTRVIDNMTAKGGDPEIIAGLKEARTQAQGLAADLAKANLATAMTNFPGGVPSPAARPAGAGALTGDEAKLPSRASAENASAYDRETESIEKHTLKLQADAATVGETVDKQEEYRIQLQLTEAVLKDGTEWTQKLNDQIALTSERAGEAKLQLAQHEFALQKLNTASQAVGSALSTAFADAIVEGKKFSDVMTSLVQTLEKAAINQLVMQFFTTPAGGGTSIFATALKGIGFAGGTDYAPGGLAMVGEKGPELVNLPRGSQVIPNDAIGNAGGGGNVSAPVVFNVDNRGASVDAVARMGQIMTRMQAELPGRIVSTIQQARRGRVPGI